MTVRTGTASWTDPTLIKCKCFYPPEAKTAEDRLRYYASHFNVVEVDSSYYALPSVDNSLRWVERTDDGFVFDIKAFRAFTLHKTPLKSLPSELRDDVEQFADEKGEVRWEGLPDEPKEQLWSLFEDALKPLNDAGKLGYILLQLPPWVMKKAGNMRHLAECADRLEGYTVAVEFRHRSWMDEGNRREVIAFLREQNVPYVIVDEPQGFPNSVPAVWEATSDEMAVVRFHGRNRETWNKRKITAAERFDYLYSEEELQEFVEPVQRLAEQTKAVHAIFNNCYEDKAVQNAQQFAAMLGA
jgi:uncharacterized protein YecE (DUF72 family)